jgi:hypothetical protein
VARGTLTAELLDTDDAFSGRRIALQATVLHWLEALPGAAVPWRLTENGRRDSGEPVR